MEIAKLILEYLKALLSAQVIFGGVSLVLFFWFREDIKALLLRIAKIRFPGGAEVSTSQSERQINEERIEERLLPQPNTSDIGLPDDLTSNQREVIKNIIGTARATAYLWEYRYLNHFLVYKTQMVLDWLISLPQTASYSLYDAIWLPLIPSAQEREAVISALETHHLVQIQDGIIKVTPKGLEYKQWRGPLPQLPLTTDPSNTPQ